MATFADVSGRLGYDILSPMYQALGGQGNPFYAENPEGGPGSYYGVKQAQALGGFDPSFFDPYSFDWQSTGKGNTGTLTAFKDGQSVGSWKQKDEQLGESLMNAALLGGGAFGLLGMAGAGPMAGLFGGGGSAGAAGSAISAPTAGTGLMPAASLANPAGMAAIEAAAMSPMAVGAGSAAGGAAAGGLLGGLKTIGGKGLEYALSNPKAAGAIVGGLLGGMGGSSGAEAYSGPMPTITRGNWNANPQAQMMQRPQFNVTMPTQGNANSGLLRYTGR